MRVSIVTILVVGVVLSLLSPLVSRARVAPLRVSYLEPDSTRARRELSDESAPQFTLHSADPEILALFVNKGYRNVACRLVPCVVVMDPNHRTIKTKTHADTKSHRRLIDSLEPEKTFAQALRHLLGASTLHRPKSGNHSALPSDVNLLFVVEPSLPPQRKLRCERDLPSVPCVLSFSSEDDQSLRHLFGVMHRNTLFRIRNNDVISME